MDDNSKLIKRLQDKEDAAWEEVVGLYYNRLLLVCARYVRDQSEAHDLAQETLVKAMAKIDKFDTNRFSSLRPWLWQMARNVGVDHVRARKNKEDKWQSPRISDSATTETFLKIMDENPGPRTEADVGNKYKILCETLDQLKEIHSEVAVLHYMDGLTRKEIAELLNLSENTVKSRLKKALKDIRGLLPKELYDKS